MATMYEVFVQASEPWHAGIRRGFNQAVADYVESNLTAEEIASADFDADAQLMPDPAYAGWGANAHEDADGPVFTDAVSAKKLGDLMRFHIGAQASVIVARL